LPNGILRLLDIGKSKSSTEREWFAEREREKGNDLFKVFSLENIETFLSIKIVYINDININNKIIK